MYLFEIGGGGEPYRKGHSFMTSTSQSAQGIFLGKNLYKFTKYSQKLWHGVLTGTLRALTVRRI